MEIHQYISKICLDDYGYKDLGTQKSFYEFCNCYKNSSGPFLKDASMINSDQFFCKEYMQHIIDVKFEEKYYMAMENYDAVLKIFYGDYMELPPKEKRISNHHHYKLEI